MADPLRLHQEDRPDFEAVLHLALTTPDIRDALSADPTGRATVRLRLRALNDADEIAAAAREEYCTYLALRTSARPAPPRRPPGSDLLPALAVLTPLVATTSAAALLLLGYLLQLADPGGALAGSLVTAGWVLTLIAGTSALLAFAALLRTAIRGSDTSVRAARLQQSRLAWQQALLDRGLLPHLRRHLLEDPSLGSASPLAVPEAVARPRRPTSGAGEQASHGS